MPSIALPQFLQNASFSRRLTYAFAAVILLASLSFPVSLHALWRTQSGANEVSDAASLLGQAVELQQQIGTLRANGVRYAVNRRDSDGRQVEKARSQVSATAQKLSKLEGLPDEEARGWQAVGAAAGRPVSQLASGVTAGKAAARLQADFEQSVRNTLQQPTATLAALARDRVEAKRTEMMGRVRTSLLLTVLILGLAGGVAALLAYGIPRQLMQQLRDLRVFAHKLASGDLTARADWNEAGAAEEIADLVIDLNTMAKSLQVRHTENETLKGRLEANLQSEQERATRDPLTSLRNHRYFQDSLRSEIDRCSRTGGQVTIATIDLDNFKQVNDRFGHHEGDAVLQRATRAISESLRPYDLACRLGGEEFGVIFPETAPDDALVVLDRIARAVEGCGPNGERCTFSGGIATYPVHSQTQVDLFQKADEASYTAKSRGKAHSLIWSPTDVVAMDSKEHARQRSRDAVLTTARTLVAAVDQKDPYTRNHSDLTAVYAATLGRALGLGEDDVKLVHQAAQLHDVGKIGISDSILKKAGRLTPEEYEQVKQHPEFSYRILQNADIEPIATWVRHHHEHWNGSGYPFGLAGDDIPLGSRIVLVADAFEAMTSDRVYRRALTVAQAIQELRDFAGVQFDPRIAEMMISLVTQGVFDDVRARYGLAPASANHELQPVVNPLTHQPAAQADHAPAVHQEQPPPQHYHPGSEAA